jgi:alginate O-acetyltransferase complex protein AlgI
MRAKELIRQFAAPDAFRLRTSGLWWIVSGLFLKVVLADQLSPKLDVWYSASPDSLRAADVVVLALGFGVQMYLDFVGYSRIAVGSGRCLGIELVENFNYPFSAVSPADFWNRWHISLSRWIRDYVFIAFVGRSRGLFRLCQAALFSMLLCGLWHGFGVKFAVWGLFHGAVIAGYHCFRAARDRFIGRPDGSSRLIPIAGWAATLVALLPGWVLFRAETLTQAGRMLSALVTPGRLAGRAVEGNIYLHVAVLFVGVLAMPWVEQGVKAAFARIGDRSTADLGLAVARGALLGATAVIALVYLGTKMSFVYFQF